MLSEQVTEAISGSSGAFALSPHDAPPCPQRGIGEVLASWARQQGDRLALVGVDESVTWSQLHASVQAIGGELARRGLGPAHRVGLVVPDGPAAAQLILGICCHCSLVPINPASKPVEMIQTAAETRLDALVVPASLQVQWPDLSELHELVLLQALLHGGKPVLRPVGAATQAAERAAAPRESRTTLLLRSSGTTGKPKLVPVTHRNMLSMAAKMASPQWFGLGPEDRAASILPLYYAAGIKTQLLVPLMVGGSVAFAPPGRGVHISEWLFRLQPTYFGSSPASLRGIVERLETTGADVRDSSLRFIMCGASYLPEDLRQRATEAFGVPILEYYGLSEAGVMAANPLPPREARPGSVGRPLGDDLIIVDDRLQPLPAGSVGEIAVRGPSVTPGYLLGDGSLAGTTGGMLRTGDMGRIDAEGFLHIAARVKEVINRGGEKVFPYEVERCLLEHEDVLEAAVYGVPHPRLGQGVAAAVVLRPGSQSTVREIVAWLSARLAAHKVPRRLRILASLPRGEGGKVLRGALADMHVEQAATREAPESLLEIELLGIWQRMLKTTEVGIHDDFLDRGGDSLLAVDLLLEVEKVSGVSTEGWDLSTLSVRAVSDQVLRALATGAPVQGRLLQQVKGGEGIPLLFCHGDRLARGIYAHRLADVMLASNPLWLLNCSERDIAASIEEVAAGYVDEVLAALQPTAPPRVFVAGFCRAGLVAWHLSHLLQQRGVKVVSLMLIDTPSLNASGVLRHTAGMMARLGALVPGRAGAFMRIGLMRGLWAMRRKGLREFGATALRRTRRKVLAPPPEHSSPEEWRRREMDRVGVRFYQQISRYVPPALGVPVTCLIAEQGSPYDTQPSRWKELAAGVQTVSIPGTHNTVVLGHRSALASRLAECLGAASQPSTGED